MRKTVWDPLRRKEVALTPEEEVRQWFIAQLRDSAGVPLHLMMSEAPLQLGAKKWRADIVVYDRNAAAVMVVECKRPEVELTREVLAQAIRYDSVLGVKCIAVTNGKQTCVAVRTGDKGFEFMDRLPSYEEILNF